MSLKLVLTASLISTALGSAALAAPNDPPFASFAVTANQAAVGAAFDNSVGVPSPGLAATFASINGLPAGQQANALAQFTPGDLALLPDLTLRTAQFEETSIERYLRDFRAGGTGTNGTAGVAPPGDRKFGSFFIGEGSDGRYDATGDRSRLNFGTYGGIGGVDARLGERSLIGITGGFQQINPNLSANSARSQIKNWFVGAYGTLGVGPLYVDLFGSYGQTRYNLQRAVVFGDDGAGNPTTDLTYASRADGNTLLAGGSVGLSFNFAGFEFEPFAGGRYARLRINPIREDGPIGAINLPYNRYTSILSDVGLRIGASFEVAGATVRPQIRGSYRHEFSNDSEHPFNYDFSGPNPASSSSLTFIQTPLGHDYALAGAGVTVSGASSPIAFTVNYDGEFDSDRRINAISGGLRLSF